MNINSKILTAAIITGFVAIGPAAYADTVSIGLQETGVNGGAITQEGSTGASAGFTGAYGSFSLNIVSGTGDSISPPQVLDSNSINVAGSTGTLLVYVTDQGISKPTGLQQFLSTFTSNVLPPGWTVVESAFLDPGNGLWAETDSLGSASLTSISTSEANTTVATGNGPYSVTEVYEIEAVGSGEANSTIDLAVPEPASLALLGSGLIAFGMARRRRRKIV